MSPFKLLGGSFHRQKMLIKPVNEITGGEFHIVEPSKSLPQHIRQLPEFVSSTRLILITYNHNIKTSPWTHTSPLH